MLMTALIVFVLYPSVPDTTVNAGKIIGPERDRGPVEPHAESPEAPSKRARLDYCRSKLKSHTARHI